MVLKHKLRTLEDRLKSVTVPFPSNAKALTASTHTGVKLGRH